MKSRTIYRGVRWLGVALVVGLFLPGAAWAVACDPINVAQDLVDVQAAIAVVEGACVCDAFASHGKYMQCVKPLAKTQAYQTTTCKRTVIRYFRKSTCSHAVTSAGNKIPCLKQTASGRISCKIRPETRCGDSEGLQDGCPGYVHCADAGDTNGDYRVSRDDTFPAGGNCAGNVCGDGEIAGGEACDDGFDNADAPDACRTDCTLPACGDEITDTGETCDDGLANSCAADACRPDCSLPDCNDAVVDTGEECDDGDGTGICDGGAPDNSDTTADACRTSCLNPSCGDGVTDPGNGEACDGLDAAACGPFPMGSGCDGTCACTICGDTVVGLPVEQCDIGPDLIANTGDDTNFLCPGYCARHCTCPTTHPFNFGTGITTTSRSRIRGITGPFQELDLPLRGSVDIFTQGDLAGGLLAPMQTVVPQTGGLEPANILGLATSCIFFEPLDPNDGTQNSLLQLVGGSPTASGVALLDCIGLGSVMTPYLSGAGLPGDPEYSVYTDHCIGGSACDSAPNAGGPCHPLLPIGACVPSSGIAAPAQCLGGFLSDDVAGAGDGCNPSGNPYNPTGLVCTKGPLEGPFRSCNDAAANPFNPLGFVCSKGQLAGPAGSCVPHSSAALGMLTPVNCQAGNLATGGTGACLPPGLGLPCDAPPGTQSCCAPGTPADLAFQGATMAPPGSVDCASDLDCGMPCTGFDKDCGLPCTALYADADCGVPCGNPVPPNSDCGAPCAGAASCAMTTSGSDTTTWLSDPLEPNPRCVPDGPLDPGCVTGTGTADAIHLGACNGPNMGPLPGFSGWSAGDAMFLWNIAIDVRGSADPCLPPTLTAPDLQVLTTNTARGGVMDAFATPGFTQSGEHSGVPFSCPAVLNSVATGVSVVSALPLLDSTALGPAVDLILMSNFDAK